VLYVPVFTLNIVGLANCFVVILLVIAVVSALKRPAADTGADQQRAGNR